MRNFFEILTLKQLGRHQKPIVVLNTNDYYTHMIDMLDSAIKQGFMTEGSRKLWYVTRDTDDALNYIENYKQEKFNILEIRKMKE